MPANTTPVFPVIPRIQWTGNITAANTAKDGTGMVNLAFTAGENGSRIDQIKVRAKGTNVATVMRFFVNNGQDTAVAANNTLVHEAAIASTTISETTALADNDILISKSDSNTSSTLAIAPPIPFLPPNYRLYVTIGTAIAAGLQVSVFGGDY